MRSVRSRSMSRPTRRAFLQATSVAAPAVGLLALDAAAHAAPLQDAPAAAPTAHTAGAAERERYEAAYQRLKDRFSLERVARDRVEVGWDDLVGMATPLSRQIPIQACGHYQRVFLHPDMSISLGRDAGSVALGFAVGPTLQWPDLKLVTRKLHDGYRPIVDSSWRSGDIEVEQTALTFLPDAAKVSNGRERQYLAIRLTLTNRAGATRRTSLAVLVGLAGTMQGHSGGHLTALSGMIHGASHWPFTASRQRWQQGPADVTLRGQALYVKDRLLLTFKGRGAARPVFHRPRVRARRRGRLRRRAAERAAIRPLAGRRRIEGDRAGRHSLAVVAGLRPEGLLQPCGRSRSIRDDGGHRLRRRAAARRDDVGRRTGGRDAIDDAGAETERHLQGAHPLRVRVSRPQPGVPTGSNRTRRRSSGKCCPGSRPTTSTRWRLSA